ncbi:MAG: VOC family protein [Pseudomonadota bacterium]
MFRLAAVLLIGLPLLFGCEQREIHHAAPENVDHIIYAVPDLETGMAEIETLLGVRPVIGGRHPQYGTHNALLSLGPSTYLEIIAPAPDMSAPERGYFFGAASDVSRLAMWVLRTDDIETLSESAVAAGVPLGQIEAGRREKPDGTAITWKASDPYAMPLQGAVPFLIEWGEDTLHPAQSTPPAGELIGLSVEHPRPDDLRRAFDALGVELQITQADAYRLVATVRTLSGAAVEID